MRDGAWLRVVYCEGWDAEHRTIAGRLSQATARERDRRGEQYAFCLVDPDTERVVRVAEIAWRHNFARCWSVDEHGRRHRMVEYRELDGRWFRLRSTEWTYPDRGTPEFDEDRSGRVELAHTPDGRTDHAEYPNGRRGGSRHTQTTGPATELYQQVRGFSDWAGLVEVGPGVELVAAQDPQVQESVEPPWRPSQPMRPEGIDALFQSGRRWALRHSGKVVVTKVVRAGTVRMPTGLLVATDPASLGDRPEAFDAAVAPGKYKVELAVIRFADDPKHERVAAARLVVTSKPVVSWELALEPGQDPRLLADGEFYGFGVDTGMGCFADAASAAALAKIVHDSYDRDDFFLSEVSGGTAATVADPASGGNMVVFAAGWGDGAYPTWIGRTATGSVACFVADMLILRDAAMAPQTATG